MARGERRGRWKYYSAGFKTGSWCWWFTPQSMVDRCDPGWPAGRDERAGSCDDVKVGVLAELRRPTDD